MTEEENDTRTWFLRISSGVVFGPVPTKALRLWAEQGRVQPGNEISPDRSNWIPAQSLDELDIVWYLEDSQGNLTGPFNKKAAEKLIADGRVGDGTSIVHKDDADLAHLVRPALENRRRKQSAEDAPELDFGSEDDAASKGENELRTECDGLRLKIEVLEKSQKQLLSAAEKECKSHERQLAAERSKVSKLEAELEEARLIAATAQNALREATAKSEADKAGAAEDSAALRAELDEKTRRIAEMEKEFAELLTFSNQRDAETQAEITDLQEQAERRGVNAAEMERRIAELEKENARLASAAAEERPQEKKIVVSDDADLALAAQIEFLSSLLDDSQKAQHTIRSRIDEIVAIRSGGHATASERQAEMRAERAEAERRGEEIKNLRLEQARLEELAAAREKELQRRIRILEIDLDETKEAARETDALRDKVRQLEGAVNDRDQIIVRERKERADEQQPLEQAQNALLLRIETMEKAAASAPEQEDRTSDPGSQTPADAQPAESPRRHIFRAAPWMSFKK